MYAIKLPSSLSRFSLFVFLAPLACFDPGASESSEGSESAESLELRFTLNGQTDPDPIVEAAALELAVELAPDVDVDHVEFWVDGQQLLVDVEPPYQGWWVASDDSFDGEHEFVARAQSSTGEQGSASLVATLDLPTSGTPTWQLDGNHLGRIWDLDLLGSEVVVLGESGVQRLDGTGEVRWRRELPFLASRLACDSSSGTVHVVGVEQGSLVDARIDADGELIEWIDLAPAAELMDIQDGVARNGELAVTGTWRSMDRVLPWLGLFGREGEVLWTNDFTDDSLSLHEGIAHDLALDDEGNLLVALDVARGFSSQPSAELHRYGRQGELNLFSDQSAGSRAYAVEVDADGTIVLADAVDGVGGVIRYSNGGAMLDSTALIESDSLVLSSWRGRAGVGMAIGGEHPMVGRFVGENLDWTVALDDLAGQRARALAIDDLGYVFALYADAATESRLLRLHP